MCRFFIKMLCCLLVISLSSTLVEAQIPDEAIRCWEETERLLDPLQFTYHFDLSNENRSGTMRCARQGSLMKCEYYSADDDETPYQVALKNNDGVYLLEKDKDDDVYYLAEAKEPSESLPQLSTVLIAPEAGYSLDAKTTLLDVARNPDKYEVTGAKVTDGYFELSLEYLFNGERESAVLLLEPSKKYRIHSITYHVFSQDSTVTISFEYSDDAVLGEVIPIRRRREPAKAHWETLLISQEFLPESEFDLARYGLPRYTFRKTPSRWMWVALAVISIIVLVTILRTKRT